VFTTSILRMKVYYLSISISFFNKCDIPWVQLVWHSHYNNGSIPLHNRRGSFWWKDVLKLLDSYKGMASVTVGDGSTNLF